MRDALRDEPALAGMLRDPAPPLLLAPLVIPPLDVRQAAGLDLILEGFLLHHGRPRHLSPPESGRRVLAGDYCYAQGLVRVAEAGDLFVIAALADLISLGAGLAARGEHAALAPLWRTTAAAIAGRAGGDGDDAAHFLAAKDALRARADAAPITALASALSPLPELEAALSEPMAAEVS